VLLLAIFIICGTISATSKGEKEMIDVSNEPLKEDVDLLTTDNLGKALEIQAMLAKHGIVVARAADGTKSVLRLKAKNCTTGAGKCTTEKRDMAVMLIVESGLYDQNVGLEVFDKGDFTSTKEDKRIRLVRAMNGELARLIKRIDGMFPADEIIRTFQNFFFNKMVLDITAIEGYQDVKNIQKLSIGLDMSKVILLLDNLPETTSPAYLSKLISIGIYNFTTNEKICQ
jgi:hypothetical protein